jgi:hypothetical protein
MDADERPAGTDPGDGVLGRASQHGPQITRRQGRGPVHAQRAEDQHTSAGLAGRLDEGHRGRESLPKVRLAMVRDRQMEVRQSGDRLWKLLQETDGVRDPRAGQYFGLFSRSVAADAEVREDLIDPVEIAWLEPQPDLHEAMILPAGTPRDDKDCKGLKDTQEGAPLSPCCPCRP